MANEQSVVGKRVDDFVDMLMEMLENIRKENAQNKSASKQYLFNEVALDAIANGKDFKAYKLEDKVLRE